MADALSSPRITNPQTQPAPSSATEAPPVSKPVMAAPRSVYWSALMDSLQDGLFVRDRRGVLLEVNARFCQMTGFSREELVGRAPPDPFWPPEGRAAIESAVGQYLAGTRAEFDLTFQRKDGERFPVILTSAPLYEADAAHGPAPAGAVVIVKDVTERKRAMAALRRGEGRLRGILDAALDCIITIDSRGHILEFNPAAERTFLVRRQDVIGKELAEVIVPPSLRDRHRAGLAEHLRTGRSAILGRRLEITALRGDGSEFPVELAVTRVAPDPCDAADAGAPRAADPVFTAYLRDLTDRRRDEDRLRHSEERYRLLVEGVKDVANLMLDTGGRVVNWGDGAERLTGYAAAEIIGRPFGCFFPREDAAAGEPERALARASADPRVEREGWLVRKDARRFWADLHLTALRDARGSLRGFAMIVRDFSERKAAEEALRARARELDATTQSLKRTNKELDDFAYIASHDLKAPLRGIANLSEWIEEDLGASFTDEARQQMSLLRGRVRRMEALIDGILQYSRAGRVRAEPEVVDVGQLVAEVVDLLHPPAPFRVEVGAGMPVLAGERLRLQQVFLNLIGNGIKHHDRPDGRVSVAVSEAGDGYEFSVADDGPGIAPQYHQKIFALFQTLAPRDKVEGTGVGLALVKKIVEDQGGSIRVESADRAGATFRFTWSKTPLKR